MQTILSNQYFDYEGHNPWHTLYDRNVLLMTLNKILLLNCISKVSKNKLM